jgi:hypothetical protein
MYACIVAISGGRIMPSKHQHGSGNSYNSEAEKMLSRNRMLILAIIRGMRDLERVQEWIETEVKGQSRKKIIGQLNQKKAELES